MAALGVDATARASFGVYNGRQDVEALIARPRAGDEDFRVNEERRIETEEVDGVAPPPKARVGDVRDASSASATISKASSRRSPPSAAEAGCDLYEAVIEALKDIYDPEIPVNIYDLGLIYDVEITPENHAKVKMTLTTPHCPVAESMPGEVELRVGAVPGIGDAEVELVWDPPWDPQKMSDEARLELGML